VRGTESFLPETVKDRRIRQVWGLKKLAWGRRAGWGKLEQAEKGKTGAGAGDADSLSSMPAENAGKWREAGEKKRRDQTNLRAGKKMMGALRTDRRRTNPPLWSADKEGGR